MEVSGAPGQPIRVRMGQEFSLKVGQQAEVDGGRFRVRFGAVQNDSRCPVDVTCVWAGNAEVMIEAQAKRNRASLKLNTQGGDRFPNAGTLQRYTVELISLQPQPRQSRANAVKQYMVTLVIRKK